MADPRYDSTHSGSQIDDLLNKTGLTEDYIIEQGTSQGRVINHLTGNTVGDPDTWYWKKYNSGYSECWGMFPINIPCTNSWGAIFETDRHYIGFPSGLFVHTPMSVVSLTGTAGWIELGSGLSSSRSQLIWICRGASKEEASDYVLIIHAFGRWKD